MKKLLLSLGAIAAVVAPVTAVVACGNGTGTDGDKTIAAMKDLDIKTINSSKLSATDKASAIALINSAKTMEGLTKAMTEITNSINKAAKDGTGSQTGTPDTSTALADAKATAIKKINELVDGGLDEQIKTSALAIIGAATTEEQAEEAFQTALDSIGKDKDVIIQALGIAAVKQIEAIASDASDKFAQVNLEIDEFIKAEGFGAAFNEDNQQKQIQLVKEGFVTPVVGDTHNANTFTDTNVAGSTAIATGDIYIAYHDKSMADGVVWAWKGNDFFTRGDGQQTNTFETQQNLVLKAAIKKLA